RRHTRSKRDWSSDVCSSDLLCAVLRCGGSTPVLSAEVQRSWAVGGWLRVGKRPRAGAGGRAQRSELLPDCGSCGRCSSEGFPEEGACGDWPSAGSDGSIEPASPKDREPCGRGAPEVSSCSGAPAGLPKLGRPARPGAVGVGVLGAG